MHRTFWAALGIFLMTTVKTASAQGIVIRSGEHGDFSRLVVQVPPNQSWSVEEVQDGVRLDIDAYTGGFDASQVFSLIDRQRISDVVTDASGFLVSLACPCNVSSFTVQDNFAVLDVFDPDPLQVPDRPNSEDRLIGEVSFAGSPDIGNQPKYSITPGSSSKGIHFAPVYGLPPREQPKTQVNLDWNGGPEVLARNPILASNPIPTLASSIFASQSFGESTVVVPDFPQETQSEGSELNAQILAYINQGLLNLSTQVAEVPAGSNNRLLQSNILEVGEQSRDLAHGNFGNRNVHSNLVVVEPSVESQHVESWDFGFGKGEAHCIKNEFLSVEDWASDDSFSSSLAAGRLAVYDEAGNLDFDSARDLVRTYIYFGFGAEALSILSLNSKFKSKHRELYEVAALIEYGSANKDSYLAQYKDCGGNVALWSILSSSDTTYLESNVVDAALRTLNRLPSGLRSLVGPVLSRRLLSRGDRLSSDFALRSTDRALVSPSGDAQMARVQLQISENQKENAISTLTDLVESNSDFSAQALVSLVDAYLSQGDKIDESIADLIEAYIFEMRGSPVESSLRRSLIFALAYSDQFDRAFNALEHFSHDTVDSDANLLYLELMKIFVARSSNVEFLDRMLAELRAGSGSLDDETSLLVGERAFELGFVDLADRITEAVVSFEDYKLESRFRLLRSKIALRFGNVAAALDQISGASSHDADILRAEILSAGGRHEKAAEVYEELGKSDELLRTSFLAEDWRRISSYVAVDTADLSDVVGNNVSPVEFSDQFFEDVEQAIVESEAARNALDDVVLGVFLER